MLKMPEPAVLADELSSLFSNPVKAKTGAAPAPQKKRVTCVFSTRENLSRVAAICDLALANHMGCALALIPAKIAEDATAQNSMPQDIFMNFREVMNVLSGLLNTLSDEHLVLKLAFGPADVLPADLVTVLSHPVAAAHYVMAMGKVIGIVSIFALA
jgi:hypothetical protein